MKHYRLEDGRVVVEEDLERWSHWMVAEAERRVLARSDFFLSGAFVQTTFLGRAVGVGDPPLLWETRFFPGTSSPAIPEEAHSPDKASARKAHDDLVRVVAAVLNEPFSTRRLRYDF